MSEIKLRELKGSDIFKLTRLINKLDLLDSLKELFSGELREKVLKKINKNDLEENDEIHAQKQQNEQVGFDYVIIFAELLIQKLPNAEDEVNAFLADLAGVTTSEIADLSLISYLQLIKDFFAHNDFKKLSELLSLSTKSEK